MNAVVAQLEVVAALVVLLAGLDLDCDPAAIAVLEAGTDQIVIGPLRPATQRFFTAPPCLAVVALDTEVAGEAALVISADTG